MPTKKKNPHQRRQANIRAEAARARQHQARRRRQLTLVGVVVVGLVLVLVLALVLGGGDDGETDLASDTSTTSVPDSSTTAPPVESAAGKPCVAMSDQPPPGAPNVPVRTGAPPSELITEDIKAGDGATVNPGDEVTVNYIGVSCSTGKIFDSSYARNQPASFPLSGVIVGWQKGIPGMKVGGQRLLGIPPDQAYGKSGQPPDIAPDETLWFVVEVLEAKAAAGG